MMSRLKINLLLGIYLLKRFIFKVSYIHHSRFDGVVVLKINVTVVVGKKLERWLPLICLRLSLEMSYIVWTETLYLTFKTSFVILGPCVGAREYRKTRHLFSPSLSFRFNCLMFHNVEELLKNKHLFGVLSSGNPLTNLVCLSFLVTNNIRFRY